MKIIKFTSVFFACLFLMCAFAPQLSAKHHKHRSTSFSLNFNIASFLGLARPAYEEVTVVRPVPTTTIIRPAPAYVEERVVYPGYEERVVVERPYRERVYVQPGYTTYSYWRY